MSQQDNHQIELSFPVYIYWQDGTAELINLSTEKITVNQLYRFSKLGSSRFGIPRKIWHYTKGKEQVYQFRDSNWWHPKEIQAGSALPFELYDRITELSNVLFNQLIVLNQEMDAVFEQYSYNTFQEYQNSIDIAMEIEPIFEKVKTIYHQHVTLVLHDRTVDHSTFSLANLLKPHLEELIQALQSFQTALPEPEFIRPSVLPTPQSEIIEEDPPVSNQTVGTFRFSVPRITGGDASYHWNSHSGILGPRRG